MPEEDEEEAALLEEATLMESPLLRFLRNLRSTVWRILGSLLSLAAVMIEAGVGRALRRASRATSRLAPCVVPYPPYSRKTNRADASPPFGWAGLFGGLGAGYDPASEGENLARAATRGA